MTRCTLKSSWDPAADASVQPLDNVRVAAVALLFESVRCPQKLSRQQLLHTEVRN